jgi:glycosyltransferase involved in cell wall biosynthesis
MKIWIEAKTPANQNGGITKWFDQIITYLYQENPENITLVYPKNSIYTPFPKLKIKRLEVYLPLFFPRKLSMLLYDLIFFRLIARFKKPDLIISPYFDVIMPKRIKSVISIHDLCFLEVPKSYSFLRRNYFLAIMKFNSKRVYKLLTVSEYSKSKIVSFLNFQPDRIFKLPNFCDQELTSYVPSTSELKEFKEKFNEHRKSILYCGGLENRKNIPFLVQAIEDLNYEALDIALIITGFANSKWRKVIDMNLHDNSFIYYLENLTLPQLKVAYQSVDGVVYPSLSEGFGRPCLEAMALNVPLTCSNLEVFHEVAGNYPIYFDPTNLESFKEGIKSMLERDRSAFIETKLVTTFSQKDGKNLMNFING